MKNNVIDFAAARKRRQEAAQAEATPETIYLLRGETFAYSAPAPDDTLPEFYWDFGER